VQMSLDDNISIYAWMDSKAVACISNVHPAMAVKVSRRTKGRAQPLELDCPLALAEYNQWMGAIDDFDRLMSFHSAKLRSRKWWLAIFYFLIDVAAINALHLWRLENPADAGRFSRRVWIAGLIVEILEAYGTKRQRVIPQSPIPQPAPEDDERPAARPGGKGGSHRGLALAGDVLASDARLTERHFPAKEYKRGNCALCYHTRPDKEGEKQVVWHCEQCQVMLHVPECFKEWHTKKKPKSKLV
jgi:hypothetical protein